MSRSEFDANVAISKGLVSSHRRNSKPQHDDRYDAMISCGLFICFLLVTSIAWQIS
jgi:hypothetical protein